MNWERLGAVRTYPGLPLLPETLFDASIEDNSFSPYQDQHPYQYQSTWEIPDAAFYPGKRVVCYARIGFHFSRIEGRFPSLIVARNKTLSIKRLLSFQTKGRFASRIPQHLLMLRCCLRYGTRKTLFSRPLECIR